MRRAPFLSRATSARASLARDHRVTNELAALRRGYKLALEKGLPATMPVVKLPNVRNARSAFFEAGDLAALLLLLPVKVRSVAFLAATGWRVSEALGLTWDAIDWDGQTLGLAAAETKGGEARPFPFGDAPDLQVLLEARWQTRRGVCVFHRDGKPIKDFRRAWARACKQAGLADRLVHDLRRTFAREMRRAGVSEGEIMRLAGWRSRSMFDRYNIIDEADLSRAVARRYGEVTVKSEPPAVPSESLSSSAPTTPL
jgi:integrase